MGKVAEMVASYTADEPGMRKYTRCRPYPTHDEIAQLAYSLYVLRGRQNGHDMEDWLLAEAELERYGE